MLKKIIFVGMIVFLPYSALHAKSDHNKTYSVKKKLALKSKAVPKTAKKNTFWKHLNGYMNLGLGHDTNVFLSPSTPYVDYSTSTYENLGLVTPIVHSGAFTYIDFLMAYDHKINKKLTLLADYKYKGRLYLEKALENANKHHQVVSLGALYKFKNTNVRKRHLQVQTFAGQDYTIYYDHDDGDHKITAAGADVFNRNQYNNFGLKTSFFMQQYKWEYHAKFLYEFLDFAAPSAWSELDHHHYYLLADAQYKNKRGDQTKFGYRYTVRDYLYRGSYDMVNAKPKLITVTKDPTATRLYTYHDFFAKEKLKLSKHYLLGLGYLYTYRIDGYAGYNTSHRNQINTNLEYRLDKKLKAEAGLLYAYTNFPTAWAFDRMPTLPTTTFKGDKYYSKYGANLKGSYRQNKKFSYELDLRYTNYSSSDDRYIYDRFLSVLSLKYRY